MLRNRLTNKKGITLLSLVITIILLIILAGISISLSLGNNGLFRKSKDAKELYVNAETEEKRKISGLEEELDREITQTNKIPYKGLGYKFIYDGTLGEAGVNR